MGEPEAGLRHIDDGVFRRGVLPIWRPNGVMGRAGLIAAIIVGWVIFGIGAPVLHLPELPGFDGSLLHQSAPISSLVGVFVLLFAATIGGTFVAGRVRFEAGLLAATAGLLVVSMRTGNIQSVLQHAGGSDALYWSLIGELVILGGMLAGIWGVLWFLGSRGIMKKVSDWEDGQEAGDVREKLREIPMMRDAVRLSEFLTQHVGAKVMATVVQVLVMGPMVMLVCQSGAKNQALAAVAIGSFVGTAAGYGAFGARPSIWYWMGPIAVGCIGYGIAAFGGVSGLAIGTPDGMFGGLARPLPVDYASVGPAMAMVGYWAFHKRG